jgi:sortase A
MSHSKLRVLGTVLTAIGVGISGFAIWQMVGTENLTANNQNRLAEVTPLIFDVSAEANSDGGLAVGQVFAKLRVPRFGAEYVRQIASGTSVDQVLNTVGIGHYTNTSMPGAVGNFALAGHRSGNGGPMRNIDKLTTGDLAYVETADRIYTYRFIESAVVAPEATWVIDDMPKNLEGKTSSGKLLTLTTCTPIYVNTERYIAWFEQIAEEPSVP